MTTTQKNETLAKAKIGQAERYERLAKVCKSRPKRERYLRHAQSYRRQAEQLSR